MSVLTGTARTSDPGAGAAVALTVRSVRTLTPSAVEVTLDPPATAAWRYLPGQYLPVEVPVDGAVLSRCYSLTSLDGVDDGLRVVVKRVDDGRVSTHLVEDLRAGDAIRVRPPAGRFTVDPDPAVTPAPAPVRGRRSTSADRSP